jgi:putative mycofactocin binding protein MftB
MASAVSTDSVDPTRRASGQDACYAVPSPVRVRNEVFGLLFYNTEDSRLTFVKSGSILRLAALPHGGKVVMVSPESASQAKVKKLLDHLLQKGLLCEA